MTMGISPKLLLALVFLLHDQSVLVEGQNTQAPTPENVGVSTAPAMQLTSIPPSAADTATSSNLSLTTPSTLTTIGDNATTVQPSASPPSTECSKIKTSIESSTGSYINSIDGASVERNLLFPELADVFENVTVECFDSCNAEKRNSTLYTIVSLQRCKSYTISIKNVTCTPPDSIISLQWHVPPDERNFTLDTEVHSTSILFKWKADQSLQTMCNLNFHYGCTFDGKTMANHSTNWTFEMDNLSPNTNYSCSAKVIFLNETIKIESRYLQTDFGAPNKVNGLECSTDDSTNTTIAFEWQNETSLPIDGYFVKCGESNKEVQLNSTTTNYICSVGTAYTDETVTVWAYKFLRNQTENKTDGQESKLKCKTKSSEPGVVRNIHAVVISNTIRITCNQPEHPNGPEKYFKLTFDNAEESKTTCDFQKQDLSYLTTYTFKLQFYNGEFLGPPTTRNGTTKYNEKALIGFLAFLIIVTSIALIVVLYKIYRLQRSSSSDPDEICLLVARDDEKQLLNVDPIPAELLLDTYKRKVADEGRLFLAEFQSIPRVFSKLSIKDARESYNQVKNRYVDILPYDDNRVELSVINGAPGSDYINASFIDGFKEPRKYIAAQGPKDETTNDFWRMVWEQKSTIIVMVTRCEEGNRNKCAEYWPTLETRSLNFADITVVIKQENRSPDYIIRKLHVTNKKEKSSERDVTHIQFISWPDHGVPDDPSLLLKLRRRVNAFSNFFSGPIIVHCSAGVGRTGTYISIDAMLEGLDSESRVDVYGYVVNLRRQRCLMVQVEAQYILIHHALVDYNRFGETEISVPELAMSLANLKKKDPPTDPSPLESEFQRLPTYKSWRPQSAGNNQDNTNKNRNPHIVPYEFNRVGIRQDDEHSKHNVEDSDDSSEEESEYEESTKYINASFLTGYWSPRAMIAAQGPLKNTISDFWLMIFQRKVKVIVMLTSSIEEKQESCAKYWGDEKQTYEDIEVELKEVNKAQSYTVRLFEVKHPKRKETRKIYQYQYEQWNEKELPKERKELITMIQTIKQTFPKNTQHEEGRVDKLNPVLVHCSDGAHQTGIFCALWNLLDCAESEDAVDIFQTVKSLRKERPGFVSSFEEYQFLYDAMALVYPAQNGQVKKSSRQEDKVEILSETNVEKQNAAPLSQKASSEEPMKDNGPVEDSSSASRPMETQNAANGPIVPPSTDIPLKID